MSDVTRPVRLLVAKSGTTPVGATIANLPEGVVAVFKKDLTQLGASETISDSDILYIARGGSKGKPEIVGMPIKGAGVTTYSAQEYRAGVPQVTHIGFNGTDGSINIPASPDGVDFIVTLDYQHIKEELAHRQWLRKFIDQGTVGTTQQSVATNITKLINQDEVRALNNSDIHEYAFAERVSDGTFAASDNDITVTNGSKTITFATAVEHSVGTPFVVGDVIRLGGTAASNPVYVIEEINGLDVTLDIAYEGASGTVLAANAGQLSAITNWGIAIEGESEAVFFEVGVKEGFVLGGTTNVRETTTVDFGSGTNRLLKVLETRAKGYLGHTNRTAHLIPNIESRTDLETGVNYDLIVIEHENEYSSGNSMGMSKAPMKTIIAIPDGEAAGGQPYEVTKNSLNSYMASTPRAFANIVLT